MVAVSFMVFYAEIPLCVEMYNGVTGDACVAALNKAANNAADMSQPEA